MSTLTEIAQQLKDNNENIILIYGFNSTGKTQLSVAYKNLTKASNGGQHAGVYYNAYSEDLFRWDNDEEHDNANVRLEVLKSSLNQFHSFLIENPNLLKEKLAPYNPKYYFKFNPYENLEHGIASITFSMQENGNSTKISSGDTRIFVWCFFLALFEVDGWADEQNAHILIDDPVSSLDEHNIFVTTRTIFDLIKANYLEKDKMIVLTHHIGLFSILATWLKNENGEGGLSGLTKLFILKNSGGDLSLESPNNDVFLYHLHLLQNLRDAKQGELYKYHMVLLRQVLENISSFIGSKKIGRILTDIGVGNVNQKMDIINALSHKEAYQFQVNLMNQAERDLFDEIFDKLMLQYKFKLH